MKDIRLIILFLFSTISCFPQKTISIDTAIIKNSTFKPLRDCQKFINYRPEDPLCANLIRSYYFNSDGNISGVLYSNEGRDTDTTLAILAYDKNNNVIERTNYCKCFKRDTLIELSKVLYFYNKEGFLIKRFSLSEVEKTHIYDTGYVETSQYNGKGQLVSVNLRNVEEYGVPGAGTSTYTYDSNGKILEIKHVAPPRKNPLLNENTSDYTIFYSYSGDSSYTETQIFKQNNEETTFWEQTYYKDKNGKIVKTERTWVQHVKVKFMNGKYFPDPESKTAYIQNNSILYQYDSLGRISKIATIFYHVDKSSDYRPAGDYFTIFQYRDNKLYQLPTEEYINEE